MKDVARCVVLVGMWAVLSGTVHANAIYTADASFSVDFPGAITNTFGYGGPIANFTGDKTQAGTGNATFTKGAATLEAIPNPPAPYNDTRGTRINISIPAGLGSAATGTTGPGDGTADSYSQAVIGARLGNLSGSGLPGSPPRTISVPFAFSYSYNLRPFVDNPLLDSAATNVGISITAWLLAMNGDRMRQVPIAGWTDFRRTVTAADGPVFFQDGGLFSISLPPSTTDPLYLSTTLLDVQLFVSGSAKSVGVPPVPPPAPPFHFLCLTQCQSQILFASLALAGHCWL